MFFFRKKSSNPPDYSVLGVDLHSHLLPGIDDGSPDLETSTALIRGLQTLGFTHLITTPHIMGDMYPNTPEIIEDKLEQLKGFLSVAEVGNDLSAAAEYFLDDHMEQRISSNERLMTLPGNLVLCEFSMLTPTLGVREMIFDLQMQGYQVIIAHPERYVYLESNKVFYEELKDMGCSFQLNLLALGGHYGNTVSSLALYLMKRGFYDFAATDLHNPRHLEMLHDPKIGEGLKRLMESCKIKNSELVESRE